MLILFTGATGRVGTPLLRMLAARGDCRLRIATPDRPPADIDCEWIATDFRADVDFDRLVAGVDVICHLGAELYDDATMERVNVVATRVLAGAAERAGVRLFVYTSSTMAYGYPRTRWVTEASPTVDTTPFACTNSLSHYGESKLASEKALASVARRCCYVVLRPTMLVEDAVVTKMLSMRPLRRNWSAYRYSHLIHVEDAAVGLLQILFGERFAAPDRAGRLQILNFSADAPDDHFADLFEVAGQSVALPRALFGLAAWGDRLKDAVKFRNLRAGWPYGAVCYAPDALNADGVRLRSLVQRLRDQQRGSGATA